MFDKVTIWILRIVVLLFCWEITACSAITPYNDPVVNLVGSILIGGAMGCAAGAVMTGPAFAAGCPAGAIAGGAAGMSTELGITASQNQTPLFYPFEIPSFLPTAL